MARQPYDPTIKTLVELDPESWPALVGTPTGRTTIIDSDIGTITGAADKALYVEAESPYVLHLEFVSGHDSASLPPKLALRNIFLGDRHEVCVHSVAILLRPEANSPQLTGAYTKSFPGQSPYLAFTYQTLRVWQTPPEAFLNSGTGLLPLATIAAVTEAELPGIIDAVEQRWLAHPIPQREDTFWLAVFVLMGLRFSPGVAENLLGRFRRMKDSSTYQLIKQEGWQEGQQVGREEGIRLGVQQGIQVGHDEEARKMLALVGESNFGKPSAKIRRKLQQLTAAEIEAIVARLRTANGWDDLLAD